MKNYFKILPILFLSLFIISCDDDNDNDGVEVVRDLQSLTKEGLASQTLEMGSLSTLVSALQVIKKEV